MKQYTYILEGRIPAKKDNPRIMINKRTGARFIAPSLAHKEWHDEVGVPQIRMQWQDYIRPLPINRCKSIEITLYYGDQYRKDNTNTTDSIHDLLVDCNIIADDCWQVTGITSQTPEFRERKPGAKIVITVDEGEVEPPKSKKKVKKDATTSTDKTPKKGNIKSKR